jgi:glutaconate CoA-transferase subunit B
MANLTNRPDLRVILGLGVNNLSGGRPAPAVHPFLFDPRSQTGEAYMVQEHVFDDVSRPDVFFVGGLEVDRRGNLNLFGIPDGSGGWKVRGPGGIALATMSTNCRGYYIIMPRHDRRTFVERVALITALGDRQERARLGLPGGGPRLVLSPLGVFDFGDDGEMRIRTLHEGVSLEQVREASGFPLAPEGSAEPARTEPPSAAELTLLRERVDIEGTLA